MMYFPMHKIHKCIELHYEHWRGNWSIHFSSQKDKRSRGAVGGSAERRILQSVFHRVDLRVSKPLTESLKDVAECRAPPSRHAGRVHTLWASQNPTISLTLRRVTLNVVTFYTDFHSLISILNIYFLYFEKAQWPAHFFYMSHIHTCSLPHNIYK